jgi:hypothetical protein
MSIVKCKAFATKMLRKARARIAAKEEAKKKEIMANIKNSRRATQRLSKALTFKKDSRIF